MFLSDRDVRRRIGRLAMVGFPGPDVTPELRSLVQEFDLGGAILFARNIDAPEQIAGVAREIRGLGDEQPLWVAVDQEGGRVARLRRPFTEWPPMISLGRRGDERLAARFAEALAAELAAVGVSLDFAPVLDVNSNPDNPVIGDRALSDRAEAVARLGSTIIRGLQAGGVAACGKHFPGHGDTTVDSHVDLPIVEHPPDRIRRVELVPFRAAIEAGVACIMTAHVLVPSFDEAQPATMSQPLLEGVLRGELGFDGLIVSDDLFMGAVTGRLTPAEAAERAVGAGCDLLLLCEPDVDEQVRVFERLIHAVEEGRLPKSRIERALERQEQAKTRIPPPRPPVSDRELREIVGCAAHVAVAEEMTREA